MTPVWTTTTPTVPGWYWWREQDSSDGWIRRVERWHDGRFGVVVGRESMECCELGGEWAGPLTPPE